MRKWRERENGEMERWGEMEIYPLSMSPLSRNWMSIFSFSCHFLSSLYFLISSLSPFSHHVSSLLILLPFSLSLLSFDFLIFSSFYHSLAIFSLSTFPHFLSSLWMPNCLNKDAFWCVVFCWQTQFTAFVASVAQILTDAFRENILDQNSFPESLPACPNCTKDSNRDVVWKTRLPVLGLVGSL